MLDRDAVEQVANYRMLNSGLRIANNFLFHFSFYHLFHSFFNRIRIHYICLITHWVTWCRTTKRATEKYSWNCAVQWKANGQQQQHNKVYENVRRVNCLFSESIRFAPERARHLPCYLLHAHLCDCIFHALSLHFASWSFFLVFFHFDLFSLCPRSPFDAW